jgi:transposase
VWNTQVLLREIRRRGSGGGYTILKNWLRPQGTVACMAALRRFETPPSKQAQVDWGHLGDLMAGAAHAFRTRQATFYGLRALPGRGLAA